VAAYLSFLLVFQRLFIPAMLVLLVWACWRAFFQRDLAVGLGLYLALVVIVDGYFNTGIYMPGLDKGSVRYSEVCALFLLFNRPPAEGQDGPPRRAATWLLGIYFFLLFLSAFRTSPLIAGIFEFRRLIVPQIVAFAVAKRGLDSPEAYRRFFLTLTVLTLIVGVFNFWDVYFDRWILKSEMLDKPIYFHNRELNRFGSLFLNPNYLGAFIVLVFPSTFVWALNEKRFGPKLIAIAGLGALVFCLVETQSRGPLLAFAIGLMLLVVGPCGGVSRTRRAVVLTMFVLVFTVLMPGFYQHAIARFSEIDRETTAEGRSRASTWIYTARIIGDHPIAGIGFGEAQFTRFMEDYGFEEEFGEEALDAPHNSYLQVAAYAGIPALLVLLLANALVLFRAAIVSMKRAGPTTPIVFGLAVGITSFLACTTTDLHLFTQNVAPVYCVFFGFLLSLVASASKAQTVTVPNAVLPAAKSA
jgi:hypothetical protein